MPAFPEEVVAVMGDESIPEYSILKQRVDLDVDFAGRSLKGSTEITAQPLVRDLKAIRLHCRQCRPKTVQIGGITAKYDYDDPYRRARMPEKSSVQQHEMLKEKIEKSLRPEPKPELTVTLPSRLKIQELQLDSATALPQYNGIPSIQKQESDALAVLETPTLSSAQQGPQFAPIKLFIEFEVASFRDGLRWIGCEEGDRRFPCMYTTVEPWAGNSSCIFPCVDDATSRSSWEISIRCPRTLGDAFRRQKELRGEPNGDSEASRTDEVEMINGTAAASETNDESAEEFLIDLSSEEAALELSVVCIGDSADDVVDTEDETRRTVNFSLTQPVAARHVGFAIGPFEYVDLSNSRGSEEEERLGQSAVRISGYCLPGRSKDLRNSCFPLARAIDHIAVKIGSFPFSTYQMVFVDDFVYDTVAVAGLSFCSSSLLFPKTVIEPLYRNTRLLVRTLADQWSGVNVIAKESTDEWIVAGMAGFMTDSYMKELAGNNEFRWQQKLAAEKVYDLDVDRPSLKQLGLLLHLDPTIRDFVNVKSALVLFILDRRMMKASGQTGVQRIINKIFIQAKTGQLVNGEVSTSDFIRACERLGHNKLESFFRQWVFYSGCPIFYVTQRFNKKKLVVEMTIVQKQLERVTKPPFEPANFMREIKEHVQEVWAPETNSVFTGPMTIRIHEADGTPYEHIVEIKEATTRLEIPYNTKYKRLKRSRRQKERQMAEGANNEGGDDALLYCLGDILDTEDEKREWDLMDWSAEDEEKMGQESYEWIRMDADFEWIGKIHLVMPLYMYISQLQQDRDIVAQYESMRYLLGSNPHHVNLTILVRTLMDSRYFWGIRELAAEGLAVCAKDRWMEKGQFHLMRAFREMFCIGDTNMPKSNDFSDRRNVVIQCAIPRAMARLRDEDGKVPMAVRSFFVDLLKFNDNSNNKIFDGDSDNLTYSDNHYVATLMTCLADSLVASHRESQPQPSYTFSFGDDEPMEQEDDINREDIDFEKLAIAQIERHRRIDEWDPSYQNIYSVTALDCLQRLTKAGVVKDKTQEVMKYVRTGNAENVRLAAWRCLSEVGVLRKMSAMRYLLHVLSEDPSPRFRAKLLAIFGEALGHIALGDPEPAKLPEQPPADSGLVLEQEVNPEARRIEAARKTTPEGALVALKAALEKEDVFKDALWYAATSPDSSLDEIAALCDIADLIYSGVSSLVLSLRLPRMWKCENLGNARVKFISLGPFRHIPKKGLPLKDWEIAQALGLKYTGPLSEEVNNNLQADQADQETKQLKLQIEKAKKELEQAQNPTAEMPPPAAIPSTERPPLAETKSGFKISVGGKRKQSMDMTPRAASPKVQKVSGQQTPTGIPQNKNSPAANGQRRSSTPSSRGKKQGKSRPVTLRLGSIDARARAQEILSTPTQSGRRDSQVNRSNTPMLPPQSAGHGFPSAGLVQSPTSSTNYFSGLAFSGSPPQTMNLGAFRSYGPPPPVDTAASTEAALPTAEIKTEGAEAVRSPAISPLATTNGHNTTVEGNGEMEQSMPAPAPPPPRPKLMLKLSTRKETG